MDIRVVPALRDLRTRNRSVDDVAAYGDDTMNVWQALEVISGNNLRKKYHYDGYCDAENVLMSLTTASHRRNSFVDKAATPEDSKKYVDGAEGGDGAKAEQLATDARHVTKTIEDKKKRNSVLITKKKTKSGKIPNDAAENDELLLLTLECPDLVKCSFNIPRISARLERLMGTNVVRLTDRTYMKQLRERIDEDYRMQLSNRIKNREIKELERERNLILEGKTDTIPEELSADPIFVVNKRANIEIIKRRAKLKTNREKNADRLLRQGLKWERERMRHEEKERLKQEELERTRAEQKAIEEQYREEDAERGLDLLRFNNVEWQPCEQSLRDFIESQRNQMKERSWRIPTQYSSDPLDIRNIVSARKKFRVTEKRIRAQLERSQKESLRLGSRIGRLLSAISAFADGVQKPIDDLESHVSVYMGDDDASGIPSSSNSLRRQSSPQSNMKERKTREMEAQVEADVQKGYLVTKDQYSNLRYDDLQIAKLRDAENIQELYKIAEKIIIGEVDQEVVVHEEVEIEDEDSDES